MNNYTTQQRKALLVFLSKNVDKAISAADIIDGLKDSHISKSAVYRNLALLEKEGEIKPVTQLGEKKTYYQYVGDGKCKGKIHVSCIKCGEITHLSQKISAELTRDLNEENGFVVDNNDTVIYGLCRKCKG